MPRVVGWVFILLPLAAEAGQAVCTAPKCSVTAGVNFKIVIPAIARVRVDEDGAVKGSLNYRQTPVYTVDKDGVVTISDP
jgi:hypothetical protein